MRISEIFDSIQGEGSNSGVPMTFIRLQGCGVGCGWCDTKYTWDKNGGTEVSINDIVSNLKYRWVCLTGGEPAEQDCRELISKIRDIGKLVQVETSGFGGGLDGIKIDNLVFSPKFSVHGFENVCSRVDRYVINNFCEMKVVICCENDVVDVLKFVDAFSICPSKVWLQPVSESAKATKICVENSLKFGFNVSVQVHKILNLR